MGRIRSLSALHLHDDLITSPRIDLEQGGGLLRTLLQVVLMRGYHDRNSPHNMFTNEEDTFW